MGFESMGSFCGHLRFRFAQYFCKLFLPGKCVGKGMLDCAHWAVLRTHFFTTWRATIRQISQYEEVFRLLEHWDDMPTLWDGVGIDACTLWGRRTRGRFLCVFVFNLKSYSTHEVLFSWAPSKEKRGDYLFKPISPNNLMQKDCQNTCGPCPHPGTIANKNSDLIVEKGFVKVPYFLLPEWTCSNAECLQVPQITLF